MPVLFTESRPFIDLPLTDASCAMFRLSLRLNPLSRASMENARGFIHLYESSVLAVYGPARRCGSIARSSIAGGLF